MIVEVQWCGADGDAAERGLGQAMRPDGVSGAAVVAGAGGGGDGGVRAGLDRLPGRMPLQVDLGQEDGGVSRRRAQRVARHPQFGHAGARRVR